MVGLRGQIARLGPKMSAWRNHRRVARIASAVEANAPSDLVSAPVVFFNASTRLVDLSLNAAFSLLSSWGLRLAGTPVVNFVCHAGMTRCVLGTNPDDHRAPPPCNACTTQSERIYIHSHALRYVYERDHELEITLDGLDLPGLKDFIHEDIPLGQLCLPSLRWALRLHHLGDDELTCELYKAFMLSAWSVAQNFMKTLDQRLPEVCVLFNGIMYPEAAARWVAVRRGIRTITHEVGFQPFSAFFTDGEATAYPIDIPVDFELNDDQNAKLDSYLGQRFKGDFTMAGIRFWPEMQSLDDDFMTRAERFRQIVPVFTNVIFDTSQVHANQVFEHMFAWLDIVLELIQENPETLFVIRAHPDEKRGGKESRESVSAWVTRNRVHEFPNVQFIDSQEHVSSYELIQRAKYVMVYNSSIGLEATLLGTAVLCGGKARYTQYPAVFLPISPQAYKAKAQDFLEMETATVPEEFVRNARRFLFYQLFRSSLSFKPYLKESKRPGFVELQDFPWWQLAPEQSPVMRAIVNGVLHAEPFFVNHDAIT